MNGTKGITDQPAGFPVSARSRSRSVAGRLAGTVTGLSRILDRMAGFCMVAVMVLVVANILLRTLFSRPILGTYEYVGFLTAMVIALALALCAVQNGHITVDFLADRLPRRTRAGVDAVINAVSVFFWGLVVLQLWQYAGHSAANGVVSPTTQVPLYPFIYAVSLGLIALCLVLIFKAIDSTRKAIGGNE